MSEHLKGEYFFLPQEHILFGAGSLAQLADEVRRIDGKRVLLITGNSLAKHSDVTAYIEEALGSLHVGTFSNIRQHSPESDVANAAQQAREMQADVLVSVGGGSPIDATKAVVRTLFEESGKLLPHIAIPTTLSAAEFSHLVGVTDEHAKMKKGFANAKLVPHSVLLDANLTLVTPMQLWLSTGIRALDHAVETLYAPGSHPISDVLALEAIKQLFAYLPQTKAQPNNVAVRTELQLAAWMSFFEEVNAPMGLSHNLGRRIGASYNVPHGITSCITLPYVMHALATVYSRQLARIADTLELPTSNMSEPQRAYAAADAVSELIAQLGLPRHLREVSVQESEFSKIAATTPSRELSIDEVEKLLYEMM